MAWLGKNRKRRASAVLSGLLAFSLFGCPLPNTLPTSSGVKASRIFAGPGQYPPAEFAAYGIVAFRTLAAPDDRAHYELICEAYVRSLLHVSELDVPPAEQMVTVWPVDSDAVAYRINEASPDQV